MSIVITTPKLTIKNNEVIEISTSFNSCLIPFVLINLLIRTQSEENFFAVNTNSSF